MRPTYPVTYYSLHLGGKSLYDFYAATNEEAVSMAKLGLRRWERLGRDVTKATLVKVMPHPTSITPKIMVIMMA